VNSHRAAGVTLSGNEHVDHLAELVDSAVEIQPTAPLLVLSPVGLEGGGQILVRVAPPGAPPTGPLDRGWGGAPPGLDRPVIQSRRAANDRGPTRGDHPMPRFVVQRTFPGGLEIPTNADGAAALSAVINNNAEEAVTWVTSYV